MIANGVQGSNAFLGSSLSSANRSLAYNFRVQYMLPGFYVLPIIDLITQVIVMSGIKYWKINEYTVNSFVRVCFMYRFLQVQPFNMREVVMDQGDLKVVSKRLN